MSNEAMKAFTDRQIAEESRQMDGVYRTMLSKHEFGLSNFVDWDAEAMTEIEGVNSQPIGGIDRCTSPVWKSRY